MTKTFTQDDIVRYLYDEIPQKEKARLELAMICDSKLLDLFKELSEVKRQLEQVEKTPSDKVIQNILDYSRSYYLDSVKK